MSFAEVARNLSIGALTVGFAVGPGCGRSELDAAYEGHPPTADVGVPSGPVDAARPTPDVGISPADAARPAPVGCAGALRCRDGIAEVCAGDGTWSVVGSGVAVCDGPRSCATPGKGISDCGPDREDCCTNIEVPGGSYVRSYDGVSCPGGPTPARPPALGCYTSPDHPSTVSAFRLDKYLVTVARFQNFLATIRASGWRPLAGSGRHVHLSAGQGLVDVGAGGEFETGWSDAWSDDTLAQDPGDNDNTLPNHPINGVTWAQAYAFCIWDGGFLPSEAEWNYVATGGDEQRVYPWSVPPRDTSFSCVRAAYTESPDKCLASGAYLVGAKSPAGDGRWGHADLAGLRPEWTLDWLRDYVDPCVDCVNLRPPAGAELGGAAASRVVRGYAHIGPTAPARLLTSLRGDDSYSWVGFRCARPSLMPAP